MLPCLNKKEFQLLTVGQKKMKTKIILLLVLAPICLRAGQVSTIYDSKEQISQQLVSEYIDWAGPYIRAYPPRFQSQDHQKKVIASSLMVLSDIKKIDPTKIENVSLLTDLAYILSMGHNLDMGTAELSKSFFEVALKKEPDNRRANYLMGMFLTSTRNYHFDSVPYLEKALELGEEDARFTLGLIAVNQGKKKEGLSMLKRYSESHPDNEHVIKIIAAIEKEELKFKTSDSKKMEIEIKK